MARNQRKYNTEYKVQMVNIETLHIRSILIQEI